MVMIVADPDAALERAVTAGATIVWPIANQYRGVWDGKPLAAGS